MAFSFPENAACAKIFEKGEMVMDRLKPRKDYSNAISSIVTGVSTAAFSAAMLIQPVMAASALGSKMNTFFKNTYNDIKTVFDVAAVLALSLCLFTLLFGRSEKTADKSYSWLFKIIIAFVVFHALGWLLPWITSQTGSQDYKAVSTVFYPLLN